MGVIGLEIRIFGLWSLVLQSKAKCLYRMLENWNAEGNAHEHGQAEVRKVLDAAGFKKSGEVGSQWMPPLGTTALLKYEGDSTP